MSDKKRKEKKSKKDDFGRIKFVSSPFASKQLSAGTNQPH